MSSIGDFLSSSATPPAARPQPAMRPSGGPGDVLAPIVNELARMDPISREITRSLYNLTFQENDIPLRIPDLGDIELDGMRREKARFQLERELAGERVQAFNAFLADLPPEVRADLGRKGMAIPGDDVASTDPELFLRLASELGGRTGFKLSKGDLMLAGMATTGEAALEERAKKETAKLTRQVSQLDSMAKLEKFGDVFRKQAKTAKDEAEEVHDVDLTSSLFGWDTDTDEPAGAIALFDAYRNLISRSTVDMRPRAVDSFIKLVGEDILDSLEEGQVDESGNIIAGTGSWDANPRAIYYLGGLLNQMARDAGMPFGDLLARLGSKAKGLDPQSWKAMALAEAAELGEDPELHLSMMGFRGGR